jgi:hypothetical protein
VSASDLVEVGESVDLLASPEDGGSPQPPLDATSIFFGLISLLLLVALVLAKVTGAALAVEWFILLFGLVGLGSAPLQLVSEMRGTRFLVTAIGMGLGIVVLTGFSIVELKLRAYGTAVFIAFAVLAAALHAMRLFRDLRRIPPGWLRSVVGRGELLTPTSLAAAVCGVAGLSTCLGVCVADEHLIPKPGGFWTSASPIWFVGLALLATGFFIAWKWSPVLVGSATLAVVVVLTATPSIVYDFARYDWTYAHIGLTLYFLQHGNGGTPSVYSAWPGFFAGISWLLHTGGVSNVEALARWWPPVIDLLGAVLIRCLAEVFGVGRRNAWLAALLFTAANTIGQDYYSPQAMAYVGFLVMLILAVRPQTAEGTWRHVKGSTLWRMDWIVLLLTGIAISVSHPLTPFVTAAIFVVLAVFGLLKSRWMIAIPLVAATGWTLVHWSLVSQYLHVSDIGNVGANLQSPSTSFHYHYDIYAHIGDAGQAGAPLVLGCLALIAVLILRDRVAWALAAGAASSGILVVSIHYGNEDTFRAVLFALPLLAVLAVRVPWHRTRLRSALIGLLVPLIVLFYVIGDMGFDYIYVVRPADLSAVQYFENSAPKGSTLFAVTAEIYAAIESTARYQLFDFYYLDLPKLLKDEKYNDVDAVNNLSKSTLYDVIGTYEKTGTVRNIYLVTLQQAAAEWAEGGVVSIEAYRSFNQAFESSYQWQLVYHTSSASVYRFITDDLNLQSFSHPKTVKHTVRPRRIQRS